jgi:hypothetical protein
VDKDNDLKDRIWVKMNQFYFVVMKEAMKKFTGWETKPTLEGGDDNYLVGVGCRNVFVGLLSSGRPEPV